MYQLIFILLLSIPSFAQNNTICTLSKVPAQPSRYPFHFCRQYENNACCLPSHDNDIIDTYATLVDSGENCPYSRRSKAIELHQLYCIGCHPNQPQMLREINGTPTVLICEAFASRLWGDGHLYDSCGLQTTIIQCGSGFQECGNNIVAPGEIYANVVEFLGNISTYGFNMDTGSTTYGWAVVTPDELLEGELCFNTGSQLTYFGSLLIILIIFAFV